MNWADKWGKLLLRSSFRKGRISFTLRDLEKKLNFFLLFYQEEIVALRDHVEGFQVHPTQIMDHVPLWEAYVTGVGRCAVL